MTLTEEQLDRLFRGVYSGDISLFDLPDFIFLFTFIQLMNSVDSGFGGSVKDFETGSLKFNRSIDYRKNISVFSGAKTFQEVKDLSMFVFAEGDIKRPFAEFRAFAQQINAQYNVNWLKTEQDMAFGMSQGADHWLQVEDEKDDLPLLKYQTVGDDRVREEHAAWDNIIRPVDDKFWDTRMPPNDFGCYDNKTEIMTNCGWKLFENLSNSDLVMTIDPESKFIKWQKPINYIKKPHSGEMVNISGNGFDMMITPDHKSLIQTDWNYKHNKDASYKLVEAKDLNKSNRIPRTGKFKGKSQKKIQIGKHKISTKLYVKLMGWYLSEGSTTIREGRSNQVKISQSKHLDQLYEDLKDLPVNVYKAVNYIGFTDNSIGEYLHKFGHSYEKYIPDELKELNPELLSLFLDKYILGDGCVTKPKLLKNGYYTKKRKFIHTSSKNMVNDLSEVILKCGYAFNMTKYDTKGKSFKHRNGTYITNHDIYMLSILNAKSFGIGNNKKMVAYDNFVYCVEVPEYNTLFVKRNGKTAWSGNCRCRAIQLESGKVTDLRGKPQNSSKMFNVNPGKVEYIFNPLVHPYFKVEKRFQPQLKKNFGFKTPAV